MDKAELKALWKQRIDGMRIVNERVNASRRACSADELLSRAERMFIRSKPTHGETKATGQEEADCREVWIKWRARFAAGGSTTSNS